MVLHCKYSWFEPTEFTHPLLQRSRNRPVRAANPNEKEALQKLLLFVNKHHAQVCLQRMVCQLSVNERFFGNDGYEFAQRLKNLEKKFEADEIKMYKEAREYGLKEMSTDECEDNFNNCQYTNNEIIRFGIRLTEDHKH